MSSSSEVVVVDILSFLGSGSGSCCGGGGGGGGGDLVVFESGLSIFSGLCGVWTRWLSMYPLRFFFFFSVEVSVPHLLLYPHKTLG